MHPLEWSYGVTCVPERFGTTLPTTLRTLYLAGFERPHIFIDGSMDTLPDYLADLPCTYRDPRVFTAQNRNGQPCGSSAGPWYLALLELYLRHPWADRYAILQDDLIACRGLRKYLDVTTRSEAKAYWNLYTFHSNWTLATGHGWYPSNQKGRGAVGLVFTRDGVVDLLSSREWVTRPQDTTRGHKSVDGGIVTVLSQQGYTEMVHHPSLLQHTGTVSSMGNLPHQSSPSFYGENYDPNTLLTATPSST